jgi:hypothetical protein
MAIDVSRVFSPDLDPLSVTTADKRWKIKAKLINEIIPNISPTGEVSSLYFEYEKL